MKVLNGYEPAEVLGFFEDICSIPHISYHEKELSDYCVAFAEERNLYYEQDELGNVIIIGEATPGYEDVEPIIIQGHLDMVGDKVPECDIDMEKESIRIKVEGDFITAEGTTLGGDDGIAIAYGLALLDSNDIPRPRLELVLTVCEEVGLEGATAIDLSCCKAKRLLNIDSEDEGVFTAGCAGGVRADSLIPTEMVEKSGLICDIKTTGFLGGHSGIEIHEGRAPSLNSNVSVPQAGDWRDTAVSSNFMTFYMARYLTSGNVYDMYDLVTNIPCEHFIILANTGTYGGGGIYNSYTLTTAHHKDFRPVVVHEFGHSFAGLGDEYFYDNADDNDNMHSLKHEPWEPNITTLVDFESKWADMMPEGIEVPTTVTPERTANYTVGLYEGGGYLSKGIYRPTDVCRMRNNTAERFCPVCERAIERVILHQAE